MLYTNKDIETFISNFYQLWRKIAENQLICSDRNLRIIIENIDKIIKFQEKKYESSGADSFIRKIIFEAIELDGFNKVFFAF